MDRDGHFQKEIFLNQGAGEQETWTSGRFPQPCPGTPWPVAAMGHLSSAQMCQWDLDWILPSCAGRPLAGNRSPVRATWAELVRDRRGRGRGGRQPSGRSQSRPWRAAGEELPFGWLLALALQRPVS